MLLGGCLLNSGQPHPKRVAVLTSAAGLGAYVPGLLLMHRLQRLGIYAQTFVIEALLLKEKRRLLCQSRKAFQKNFALARAAHRVPRDIGTNLCPREVAAMIACWTDTAVTHFVVLSGFWRPVLAQYRELIPGGSSLHVECLHVDAAESNSWRVGAPASAEERHSWFFRETDGAVHYKLLLDHDDGSHSAPEGLRLLVHGGGWGMGTYDAASREFQERGFELDLIAYNNDEMQPSSGVSVHMLDPAWVPWSSPQGNGFPPLRLLPNDHDPLDVRPASSAEAHALGGLIRTASAVVTKPGGGSLLDSLLYGCPLVLLQPMTHYEAANARLWCQKGFAVTLEDWRRAGYPKSPLREARVALQSARNLLPDFGETYAATY